MYNHLNEWLSVADVAAVLGISAEGVRRRTANGDIQAVKLGEGNSTLRIHRSELERYIRVHQVVPR